MAEFPARASRRVLEFLAAESAASSWIPRIRVGTISRAASLEDASLLGEVFSRFHSRPVGVYLQSRLAMHGIDAGNARFDVRPDGKE